ILLGQPRLSDISEPRPTAFEGSRAMEHLRRIDAINAAMGGRSVGTRGNAAVRTYVRGELQGCGLNVTEQPFGDMLGGRLVNRVGALRGGREETILVCAHHDAEGSGPAAVDGSAGLAALLELARVSSAAAESARREGHDRSRRTLLFASWDGESFGCA